MPSPHLERKLKETLGADAGEELAAVTDRIDPIRGDIAELRHDIRGDIAELRHHMDVRFAEVEGRFEKALREQMRFFFGLLLAAIVGLYGTVIALVR